MAITVDSRTDSNGISPVGAIITIPCIVAPNATLLVVAAMSRTEHVTGATWNTGTMGAARVTEEGPTAGMNSYIFELISPTSGSHDVVITASGTPSFYLAGVVWSLFGTYTSLDPHETQDVQEIIGSDITFPSMTTTNNNDVIIDCVATNSVAAITALNETRDSSTIFNALGQGRHQRVSSLRTMICRSHKPKGSPASVAA